MDEKQQESTEVNILDDLDELDKAIIRYKIEGLKNVEIAEKLGKHRDTIASRLEKEKVQFAIKELQKTAIQIIVGAQVDAAREIVRQIKKGTEDRDRREAAKEILKGINPDKLDLTNDGKPLDINVTFIKPEEKPDE